MFNQCGQFRTLGLVGAHLAADEQRAERPRDGVAQPLDQNVGVPWRNTKGLSEFRPGQSLPIRQLEHHLITLGEPAAGVADEIGQLTARSQGREVRLSVRDLRQFLAGQFAAAGTDDGQRLVAGDCVQPGTQAFGFSQLRQSAGGRHEHVLHTVRRGVTITQHSDAEVVKPVGVAVVDRRESFLIPGRGGAGKRGVVIGQRRCRVGRRHRFPPAGSRQMVSTSSWPPCQRCAMKITTTYPAVIGVASEAAEPTAVGGGGVSTGRAPCGGGQLRTV